MYEQEHVLRVRVYADVDFLLKELRRTQVPTALFTGKSRRAVEISLEQLGWDDIFQTIVTGDDIKRFKPDPEGLNFILEKTKADPARAIYIGDSPSDIAAAHGAGIKSGHAQWGVDHYIGHIANYIFNTPNDILHHLLKRNSEV